MSHSKSSFPLTLMFVVSIVFVVIVVIMMSRTESTEETTFPSPVNNPDETSGLVFTPEGWSLFSDGPLSFSINYPAEMQFERNGDNSVLFENTTTNFVYVSVVSEENRDSNDGSVYNYSAMDYEQLQSLAVGEEINSYTRLPDAQIAGRTAKVYQNTSPWEFPNDTTEVRYLVSDEGDLYILGYYANEDFESTAKQMVESFQILDENSVML